MAEPTVAEGLEAVRLEAELADLVADLSVELDPADADRLAAVAGRCDVILALLRQLGDGPAEVPASATLGDGRDHE